MKYNSLQIYTVIEFIKNFANILGYEVQFDMDYMVWSKKENIKHKVMVVSSEDEKKGKSNIDLFICLYDCNGIKDINYELLQLLQDDILMDNKVLEFLDWWMFNRNSLLDVIDIYKKTCKAKTEIVEEKIVQEETIEKTDEIVNQKTYKKHNVTKIDKKKYYSFLEELLNTKFVDNKKVTNSSDNKYSILFAYSKNYDGKIKDTDQYWYGVEPQHIKQLEKADNSYLAFATGDNYEIIVVPLDFFNKYYDKCKITQKDNKSWRHIHIRRKTGTKDFYWFITGEPNIDMTQFLYIIAPKEIEVDVGHKIVIKNLNSHKEVKFKKV